MSDHGVPQDVPAASADRAALTKTGIRNVELTPEVCAELLDPESWANTLELFAGTMRLAVALVDPQGKLLGTCHNPQPIWSLAREARPEWGPGCLFCLDPEARCTAAVDAFGTDSPALAHDRAGFAHATASLSLGGRHLGTLLAGQVFDRFPEPLSLQRLAKDFGLSAQQVWSLAGKQTPISRTQLTVYGKLLGALGQAFLRERYSAILERRLTEINLRFQLLVDGVKDYAIFTVDAAGLVTSWNAGAERLLGYTEAEILGQHFSRFFAPADIENGVPGSDLQTAAREGRTMNERWYVRKGGGRRFVSGTLASLEQGGIREFGMIMHDITPRKHAEEYLSQLAYHDALTGLTTRTLFYDRLGVAIARAARYRSRVALLMVDVDQFKSVNDLMGHDVGDKLLIHAARSLQASVRQSDTVARIGGDEFIILLADLHNRKDAELVSDKVTLGLEAPIQIGEHTLSITASIGVSVYPEDGDDGETLIKSADMAMYEAKKRGRSNSQLRKVELNGEPGSAKPSTDLGSDSEAR